MDKPAIKHLPTSLINKLLPVEGGKILIVPVNGDGTMEIPEIPFVSNWIVNNGRLIRLIIIFN